MGSGTRRVGCLDCALYRARGARPGVAGVAAGWWPDVGTGGVRTGIHMIMLSGVCVHKTHAPDLRLRLGRVAPRRWLRERKRRCRRPLRFGLFGLLFGFPWAGLFTFSLAWVHASTRRTRAREVRANLNFKFEFTPLKFTRERHTQRAHTQVGHTHTHKGWGGWPEAKLKRLNAARLSTPAQYLQLVTSAPGGARARKPSMRTGMSRWCIVRSPTSALVLLSPFQAWL